MNGHVMHLRNSDGNLRRPPSVTKELEVLNYKTNKGGESQLPEEPSISNTEETPLLGRETPLLRRPASSAAVIANRTSIEIPEPVLPEAKPRKYASLHFAKALLLTGLAVASMVVMASYEDHEPESSAIVINKGEILRVNFTSKTWSFLRLHVTGPISQDSSLRNWLFITAYFGSEKNESWYLQLAQPGREEFDESHEFTHVFDVEKPKEATAYIQVWSNASFSVPLTLATDTLSDMFEYRVVYAAVILIAVYGLIIFELVHRAIAAMLGSLAAIAVLAAIHERPSVEKVVAWLDYETLLLLFGMMIIVGVLCQSGVFDYLALLVYKLAKGRIWPLITLLCVFAGVVSAFLDNVTTILLLTPITIRLCEVINVDPKHVLMAEVLFSNIGGTATAVGDPPNVIIVSNSELSSKGVTFANFTMHLVVGIVFVFIVCYGLLRLMYRNIESIKNQDPPDIVELKHEIIVWTRAASRVQVASREESTLKVLLLQKVSVLENVLRKRMSRSRDRRVLDFRESVRELEGRYKVTDAPLLLKASIILLLVLIMFFLHSFIDELHLTLGWVALLGALLLLILADIADLEGVLHSVEWGTLIFFSGLFVLMEALQELGLIKFIGDQTTFVIEQVSEDNRLLVAIVLIIWVSAIASSFIDNIPFTTAMVPVILQLADDPKLSLPLFPLVWSLAFGACLGGNGTLIGASANVVCSGIAEQHGYGFSFTEFFKVGFPTMLVSTAVATVYLLICHVALDWNYS